METQQKTQVKNATFYIGLGLIVISLGIYALPSLEHLGNKSDLNFGVFILNYLISIIFFILACIREIPEFKIHFFYQKIEYGFIHLILCLISAYSLNREIPVFEQSTPWLQVLLILQGIVFLMVFFKHHFAGWVLFVFWGFMGISFSLFLYLSIYLIPWYLIGAAASFIFGISLHAFVPLLFVLVIIFYLLRKDNRNKHNFIGFSLGIIVSLVIVSIYLLQWYQVNHIITKASDKSLLDEKNDLPEWVVIAQQMPTNSISGRILKTDIVYSTATEKLNWISSNIQRNNFDEVKKHDPLVMISTFWFGKPNLTTELKIKILECMFDSRHQAQERLWRGDDLRTSHVLTNVRLYPNLRIGYTEKIITLQNTLSENRWRTQQEAIYTFHLPEGGVVTSLSLWMNGKEEKAVLTSKHRADSAYKTIVGVESRDPSLVRWQEGNTVSVRVFPCTPNEDRRFKIGITAPLRNYAGNLVYDNIWFDGPASLNASESIKIHTLDKVNAVKILPAFNEENANTWYYNGKYLADWYFQIQKTPLLPNVFSFDGKSYRISEYQKEYEEFDPQDIYLDINSEWTFEEFNHIRKLFSTKNVYTHQIQRIKVTDHNAQKIFFQLSALNFSVFPLYAITNPTNSLLISKGSSISPNVSDLCESIFASGLKSYLTKNERLKFFNLNQELSPYLKTLKELRVFNYDCGSLKDLVELINNKKFVKNQENIGNIVISGAGIKITETNETSPVSNAPDHLMRLFSYNNVLFQVGTHYFDKNFFDSTIVNKAYKAYVVSPVTSLIVLETQEDYKRFDIKDDGTSIKNASMKSAGAVPEPHEWLLIIVLSLIAVYIYLKKRKTVFL